MVTSNDPEHANEKLSCGGRVMQPMEISPSNISFGNVKRDGTPQYRFATLRRGDGGPIAPQLLATALPGLGAQICETVPGEEYELEVWVGPPWPQGKIRDMLRISTGVDEAPEIVVNVTGEIMPRLSASPNALLFPAERPEETIRTARLTWDDGKPAKILEATSSIPEAQVRIEDDGKAQTVVVTMPAGSERYAGAHEVTVKTDDPTSPRLSIPMTFRAKSAPAAQAVERPKPTRPSAIP